MFSVVEDEVNTLSMVKIMAIHKGEHTLIGQMGIGTTKNTTLVTAFVQ
jgi:hypothetical protein